jgi:hypothetical protein
MRPSDVEPGELCSACAQNIDANEDAISRDGRWFCTETCRRAAMLGEAEQLGLEATR